MKLFSVLPFKTNHYIINEYLHNFLIYMQTSVLLFQMTVSVVLFWNMLVLLTHYTAATRNCTVEQPAGCNKTNCGNCLEKHRKLKNENFTSSGCFPPLCSCSENKHFQVIARCLSVNLKVQNSICYPAKVMTL